MMKGDHWPTKWLQDLKWGAFNHTRVCVCVCWGGEGLTMIATDPIMAQLSYLVSPHCTSVTIPSHDFYFE